MGIEIINTLDGYFIGTVIDYNKQSRELAVYLPKLMPLISENQKDQTTITNFGNSQLSSLEYHSKITSSNSIWVRAMYFDEPLPDKGSKVRVHFLEGNPGYGFWEKFNPNNDYEVINDEKYPLQFNLKIGDKLVKVNKNDIIQIDIPDNYEVISLINNKNKIFKLNKKSKTENESTDISNLLERISILEEKVAKLSEGN